MALPTGYVGIQRNQILHIRWATRHTRSSTISIAVRLYIIFCVDPPVKNIQYPLILSVFINTILIFFLSCSYQIINGAGHHVYLDKPEIFNKYVREACQYTERAPPAISPTDETESDQECDQTKPLSPPPPKTAETRS